MIMDLAPQIRPDITQIGKDTRPPPHCLIIGGRLLPVRLNLVVNFFHIRSLVGIIIATIRSFNRIAKSLYRAYNENITTS